MNGNFKVENLTVKNILKGINLDLKEGTINALIGKNSSGKTTLLKSIFGLIPSKGLINIDGSDINNAKDKLRIQFGICLNRKSFKNTIVLLNLIEPLNNLNYEETKAKKIAYDISKKLGIENLLYKNIEELSYSEKKVVSFVQSIIHEPKVILIDNLFDSLDYNYKNKIIAFLNKLKKNKKAIIILTTNNPEELLLCDNLIILKNGKIVKSGPLKELMQDENLFIKNDIKMPFIVDLSYKLKSYDLINELIYDNNEMVNEIWK